MFDGHYDLWRQNRFNYIVSQLGKDYFQGKTMLELGGGYGDLGAMFAALGAKVTSVDARPYYAKEGMRRYPEIEFITQNLEEDYSNLGTYDIVLHTGLLYHISNIEKHLQYLSQVIGGILILETECCDSSDPNFAVRHQDRFDYDQSFNGAACAPSPAFVERLLDENKIKHVRHDHSSLNTYYVDYQSGYILYHRYNWTVSETKQKGPTHRRLWMCYKSPEDIIQKPLVKKSVSDKLKVAICISGHIRCLEKNVISLRRCILDNSEIDCDIFIHTWDEMDIDGKPGHSLDRLMREYSPKKIALESAKQFEITPLMEQRNTNQRDINGLLSMFYKIQKCNELKVLYEQECGFTYDCVMRFRGDIELLENLNLSNKMDFSKVYIPLYGDFGGINDQMAFSNSINMNIYSSTFSRINEYLQQGTILNPELFTLKNLQDHHLPVDRPTIQYVMVKSNGKILKNTER